MVVGESGGKCRLNRSKIASSPNQGDIHAIRMQCFEPPQAPPNCENLGVFQEGHQQVLVIPCQGRERGWPFAACKSFDDMLRAMTPVDIIAQEYRYSMIERPDLHIGTDVVGYFPEQVVTAMNIAYAVYPSPIRDTTHSRDSGGLRFPKRFQE